MLTLLLTLQIWATVQDALITFTIHLHRLISCETVDNFPLNVFLQKRQCQPSVKCFVCSKK